MESAFYRLFVSLPLPASARKAIAAFADNLGAKMPADAIRWTPMEQMHLTLKFLGNVDSAAVPKLEQALKTATHAVGTFQLHMTEPGAFPSRRDPRVIWLGLGGDIDRLQRVQLQVAEAAGRWCEKEEKRKFAPHLTVGRVREPRGRAQRTISAALQDAQPPGIEPWHVESAHLMRSQLSPHGARHSILREFNLT